MANEISILSFRPDSSGFYRLAAELPSGNTKHKVSVQGKDLGYKFITSDDVVICSSIFIDVYPRILLIDDNGKLNHEKLTVKFNTHAFTPMGIYATFGILKGDKIYNLLTYDEHKIMDFKKSFDGNAHEFVFEFPQGNKKLSDLFMNLSGSNNSNNLLKFQSMSQSLVVVLEMFDHNYHVSNHSQLSLYNLSERFSSPVRIIKSSDFTVVSKNVLGDEDVKGFITFELDISKTTGYGLPGHRDFELMSVKKISDGEQTFIQFKGYKPEFVDFINNDFFKKSYISNTEINLLRSGIVYVPELEKSFIIEESVKSPEGTTVIIDDNILPLIKRKNGTYLDMIVSDFLPTHYQIRSDRNDVLEKQELILKSYDANSLKFETIFGAASILDDGEVYVELIDGITGASIVKKINIDRSKVLTSTTSALSDEYVVSSIFFTKFNSEREFFWNPILTAFDGSLGISSDNDIVYLRLGSSREISKVEGYLQVEDNLLTLVQKPTGEEATQPAPTAIVGGKVLNINGLPLKNVEIQFQIILNENINLPSLSVFSNNDGSWSQSGFINGQRYRAVIVNNDAQPTPDESGGYGALFSPSFHEFKYEGKSISGLDFILSGNFSNSTSQETGNSSNNNEISYNTFILNNNKKIAYIKIDFDKILSSTPEQNLQISSDIKIFDTKGNTYTIRL